MKTIKFILIALVLILISCIILFKCNNPVKRWFQQHKQAVAVKENTQQIATIQYIVQHDTTIKYVNTSSGITHASKTVATGNYKQLALYYQSMFDSVTRELNIKSKQLDNALSLSVSTSGNITARIEHRDDYYEIPFHDDYLRGYAIIDSGIQNMMLHYEGSLKLHGVVYWTRKHKLWFIHWGQRKYTADFWSESPNISIDSIIDVKITHQ